MKKTPSMTPGAIAIRAKRAAKRKAELAAIAKPAAIIFPPANKTRAADLERAKAEGAQAKKAGGSAAPKKSSGGKRAEILAAAQAGKLPAAPDFSAETHTRFRPKLAELVALVKAKNIRALKAFDIKPISTSPKAMDRFRNLSVIALEAQAKTQKKAA